MMTQLKKQIPDLAIVTWNYQEAGHGKGAPDGIGAVVKRTADSHVRFGGDIGCFEDFVKVVQQDVKNVDLIVISPEDIKMKKIPDSIPPFKGTLKVHQAVWSALLPYSIAYRTLSCFICSDSYIPWQHNKHLGVLSILNHETTVVCEQINEEYLSINSPDPFGIGNLQIDTPTLMENIGDNYLDEFDRMIPMILSDIDGTLTFKNDTRKTIEENKENSDEETDMILSEIHGTLVFKNDTRKTVEENKENSDEETDMILSEIDGTLVFKNDTRKTVVQEKENFDAEATRNSKVTILSNIKLQPSSYNNFESYGTGNHREPNKTLDLNIVGNISGEHNFMELDPYDTILSEVDVTLVPRQKLESRNDENKTVERETYDIPPTGLAQNICDFDHRRESETSNGKDSDKENSMDLERTKYDLDTWVIVEYQVGNKTHIYIGKITEVKHETREYKVLFVKKAQGKTVKFSWPTMSDEDIVPESHIVQVLENPTQNRRGQFVFSKLPKLNFK